MVMFVNVVSLLQTVKTGAEMKQKFPEGGCMEPCTARLQCGHTCQVIVLSCGEW